MVTDENLKLTEGQKNRRTDRQQSFHRIPCLWRSKNSAPNEPNKNFWERVVYRLYAFTNSVVKSELFIFQNLIANS